MALRHSPQLQMKKPPSAEEGFLIQTLSGQIVDSGDADITATNNQVENCLHHF